MNKIIANRIYSRRLELGLSQQELAQALGTTQTAVSRYESGDRTPSIGFLRLLAQQLKLSLAELLEGK